MNIYDQHTIPKVWADYLNYHKYELGDKLALLVIWNDKTGKVAIVDQWLDDNNIQAAHFFTVNGYTMVITLNTTDAALLKLAQ